MRNNDEASIDDITIGEEAMEQMVRPKLELGHLVPYIELENIKGEMISTVDFKERKNLLILFFNPRERIDWESLAELRRRYHEFADVNAAILAIGVGSAEELKECVANLDLPFDILSDIHKEAICAFCADEGMVFAADRFGELKFVASARKDLDSVLNGALSAFELIELECPECGVSTWPRSPNLE